MRGQKMGPRILLLFFSHALCFAIMGEIFSMPRRIRPPCRAHSQTKIQTATSIGAFPPCPRSESHAGSDVLGIATLTPHVSGGLRPTASNGAPTLGLLCKSRCRAASRPDACSQPSPRFSDPCSRDGWLSGAYEIPRDPWDAERCTLSPGVTVPFRHDTHYPRQTNITNGALRTH